MIRSIVIDYVHSWQVEVVVAEVFPLGAGEYLGVGLLPAERVF